MTNRYAKLQDNVLEFAPVNKGSILNYNLDIEQMVADGYKLFVPCEIPITNRIYHIDYNETFDEIQEVIVYDETQEEADERERQEEENRINNLTMTALDFIGVLESFELDYATEIKPFLNDNPNFEKQLTHCQNVYCGVVKAQCPITVNDITITAEMVEQAFKNKYNGENE